MAGPPLTSEGVLEAQWCEDVSGWGIAVGEAIVCVKGDLGWLNRMVSERKVLADSARLVYLAHRTSQAERARFTAAEAIKKRKAIA